MDVRSPSPLRLGERLLDAGWQFRLVPGSEQARAHQEATQWHAASVPGTVHTDLLAHGLIPDPYVGAPEAGLQWIGLADWEYRTFFELAPDAARSTRSDLVFEGLDTLAEVFLNGQRVLAADNAFRTWRVPVQAQLRSGRNELRVVFHSPITRMLPIVQAMPHKLHGNYPSPYGDEPPDALTANFVRKPGYHYGWDWGPRYVTAGIWRNLTLQQWQALRIADVHVRQERVDAERADLQVRVGMEVARAGRYQIRLWQIAPDGRREQAASRTLELGAGSGSTAIAVTIHKAAALVPGGLRRATAVSIRGGYRRRQRRGRHRRPPHRPAQRGLAPRP